MVHGNRAYDPDLQPELDGRLPLDTIRRALDPDASALEATVVAFWHFNDVTEYDGVPSLCRWRSWANGCPTHRVLVHI